MEEIYREIGQGLVEAIPDDFQEAWVRTEMLEDVWSISIYYKRPSGTYSYVTQVAEQLETDIRKLWCIYQKGNNAAWTTATFHLTNSFEMCLDLGYQDISDFGLIGERREVWMEEYLGKDARVD